MAVRDLFEGLVGRDIDISDGEPVAAEADRVIAVYVNDRMQDLAVSVVDLPGAARLGGALAMLPKGGVDDAIESKDLYDTLRDNCYEVLNVMASVFNVGDAPHVKLHLMYAPGDKVPSDIGVLCATLGNRLDVAFNIAGYGPGRLSVVCR